MSKKKKPDKTLEGMNPNAKKEVIEEKDDGLPRPYLISRVGVGLLDLLLSAALFTGFYFALRPAFQAMGIKAAAEDARRQYEESGLYVKTEAGDYELISSHYDETKTPEENYDVPISLYYKEGEYPKEIGAYATYCQAKLDSGLYEVDAEDNWGRTAEYDVTKARFFLKDQYLKAVDVVESSPAYAHDLTTIKNLSYFCIFSSLTLALLPDYLFFPLFSKHHATFFQWVFKMGLARSKDNKEATKGQVGLRFLFMAFLDFYLPTFWFYFLVGSAQYVFLFFPLLDAGALVFFPKNRSFHDLASGTYVVSFKVDVLEELKRKQEEQKEAQERKEVAFDPKDFE